MNAPDGSGILLCPVGPTSSSLSPEQLALVESGVSNGLPREIDVEVFGQWLSNAREINFRYELRYKPNTDTLKDEDYSYGNFYQTSYDIPPSINLTDHPLPLMVTNVYSPNAPAPDDPSGSVSYITPFSALGDAAPFDYISTPEEGEPSYIPHFPILYIKGDTFFAAPNAPNNTSWDISGSTFSTTYVSDFQEFDPETEEYIDVKREFTLISEITDRFY